MVTPALTLAELTPRDRRAAIERAADALDAHQLVIAPTDTVYGLFASASSREALAKLGALSPPCETHEPECWHAPRADAPLGAFPITHPVHRLLVRRLSPGGVRFLLELDHDAIASGLASLGIEAGVIDRDGVVSFRIPGHPTALELLERASAPAIAKRLAAAGWTPDRDPAAAREAARDAGVLVLDDGPAPFGAPSTAVRLSRDGSWSIAAEGAVPSKKVRRASEHHVVFVCTGNTCRSPMAEMLARHESANLAETGITFEVASGGVATGGGAPTTPEALAAVRAMGIEDVASRSRPVTPRLLADADAVYVMSRHHLDAVRAIDPAARAALLDPGGDDIPDPVGLPQHVYDQTAARLRELITQRLKEAWA